METIISPLQQRAIDYCDRKQMPKIGRQISVIAYMHGAEDQDRIARQEEREKCIKRAIEVHCAICSKLFCGCRTTDCRDETIIRDAMEGGEIEL